MKNMCNKSTFKEKCKKDVICIKTTGDIKFLNFNFRFLHHFCMDFNTTKIRRSSVYISNVVYNIFVAYKINKLVMKIQHLLIDL